MTDPDLVLRSWVDVSGETVDVDPAIVDQVLHALGDVTTHPLDVVVAWDGVVPIAAQPYVPHPGPLPLGYHELRDGDRVVGTVISAPRLAPMVPPGQWGVFLPLYALRTHRTDGIACYGELQGLFDWLHDHGGEVVLTLPLLPTYLDEPPDWSPYSPVTRRMWSELYVDLDAAGAPHDAEPGPVPLDGLLDYPAIHARHAARLDAVAERLVDHPELHEWVAANPLAGTYARFRGAQAVLGRDFRTWTMPDRDALAAADPVITRRHLVGSWLADRQLADVAAAARARGQLLALDVALGAHPHGFDTWHEGDLFVEGMSVGAPPDPIFMGGQNWGFPPVHPSRSRATGHRYIRETFRHHVRHAGLLRLDHVMGLARQWWVPDGASPSEGAYVRYPLEELLAVACLEAHLAGAYIVGENLGTVPPEVNQGLLDHGLLGIHVALDDLPTWGTEHMVRAERLTMSMSSTHDTVPLASFWFGGDLHRSHRLGLISDERLAAQLDDRVAARARIVDQLVRDHRLSRHDAPLADIVSGIVDELASHPAAVVTINLEDFWLEERPQNVPGTFQEEPNWRRVAGRTLEDFAADPETSAMADRVDRARAQS